MGPIDSTAIMRFSGAAVTKGEDFLAAEEPLEIRLGLDRDGVRQQQRVAVTMRTPGADEYLALGFLFTEGIIRSMDQVGIFHREATRWAAAKDNVLVVQLQEGEQRVIKNLKRNFLTTSACGVCGKASIESVQVLRFYDLPEGQPKVSDKVLHSLPVSLNGRQTIFEATGGLHAAALFTSSGELLLVHEDIGRHNAVDKVIGHALANGWLPLSNHTLLVSGRAGFELVQKAVMAGIPVMTAVGAPSSLAVKLADAEGVTLIGFLRNGQFNVYTGSERVVQDNA